MLLLLLLLLLLFLCYGYCRYPGTVDRGCASRWLVEVEARRAESRQEVERYFCAPETKK